VITFLSRIASISSFSPQRGAILWQGDVRDLPSRDIENTDFEKAVPTGMKAKGALVEIVTSKNEPLKRSLYFLLYGVLYF
jgi:hypothetical protein